MRIPSNYPEVKSGKSFGQFENFEQRTRCTLPQNGNRRLGIIMSSRSCHNFDSVLSVKCNIDLALNFQQFKKSSKKSKVKKKTNFRSSTGKTRTFLIQTIGGGGGEGGLSQRGSFIIVQVKIL